MEEKDKKFELNIKTLDNFDKIMSTKLDEIEELKVTGLDKGSKLLNIISLCANVKTLIIEGDQRLNTDKILLNIFKPEKLENIILNNVKLPKSESVKKFENLKMISLNDIRFCNVKDFFDGIAKPKNVEIINISNTDMSNNSISILNEFINLKYLKLENVRNLKLNDLRFLKENKNILKIDIVNNKIPIKELNKLLNCKCLKNIDLDIETNEGKIIDNCKIKIIKDNKSEITATIEDFENIMKQANLYKVDFINVIINRPLPNSWYIKNLKKLKGEIHITVEDFSCLNVEQAKKLNKILKVENIDFVSEEDIVNYDINKYIEVRTQIDNILSNIPNHAYDSEKFLSVYKILATEFEIVEEDNLNIESKKCTPYQLCKIFQNCLKCMNIESNIIFGQDLENDKEHCWNQVKLQEKWYNVDLVLDIQNIKKNKVEYCLISDKEFIETHMPKAGKNNYCPENFNSKLVNVFFKTGLFKEKLFQSYIEIIIEKTKRLFNFNKKEKILELPSATENNEEKNFLDKSGK